MLNNLPRVTKIILFLNIGMYLLSNFFQYPKLYYLFWAHFPLSPDFRIWQPITHMFMHSPFRDGGAGISHILFNMFTLWSFGPALEQVLGDKKFTLLYFLSGLGAYALNSLWIFFEVSQGAPLQSVDVPMLGASGAIFGVVAAFATLFPDAKLMFMFIPFPIKAKYLLPIIILVSVYLGFSGQMGGIAHFAHVGGALVGFLMALYWKKNRYRIN